MRIARWMIAALAACVTPVYSAEPHVSPTVDFSGTWLPDARHAQAWPESLPLTPVARRFMETFNPVESDPTTLCMPFGTPRNMLQTDYPLEIVQTPQRLVMLLQPNLSK